MSRQFENGIDLANQRITSVASPTTSTDAVNKSYVDNLLSGLTWKNDVRVATTTNGTLATAFANGQSVDGQTLATGDRILIQAQTNQPDNGIYIVQASGAPVRSSDNNTSAEMNNATVSVLQGTVNGGKSFTQTAVNPTIGTTSIVWATYATGQAYTAGNGLQLISTAFSILLPASSGLSVSGSGLTIALASNPGLQLLSGGLSVLLASTNPALTTTGGLAVIPGTGITVASNTVAVDHTKVPYIFVTSIGDGSTLTYTVTHNLGTLDVVVQTYLNSGGAQVEADVVHATTNTVTVAFATAPASNAVRVVCLG